MKIGMISFAHHHAYSYGDSLAQLPTVEIAGVYDPDHIRGREAAARYQTVYHDDLSSLLASEIEAVVICSENSRHKEEVIQAARAKKHILCEKPIATNVRDAEEMIAACEEAEVILQIAFPVRFCQPIIEAKRLLDSGQLGQLQGIRTTNRGQNPLSWFVDKELSGGGAVLDHTVHMVDIIRWFTGQEVTEVYAEIDTFFEETPVEDSGILTMVLADQTIVTHDCSWSRCDNYPTWGDVTIELFGSKGTLKVDAFKEHLSNFQDQGKAANQLFFGADMDAGLIADFVACVTEKRPPAISGYDGLKAMEVGLKAYEAAAKKQVVMIK
ncbi:Gfo/Idh/MocA family oxidoreductase [Vagococcus sp. BWB3-3]|uniref:Gfo/Idh/MocA family oxidoreductase n=1 Tax=Vagococcus allomyrinae TaxID=2794353 RepID=A0A940P7N9_9ENTE|nr:Gfo/Idh/MocA family oxidoreductase [Vagococcus allomyrinae]MBP1039580.1 Gfo/Idh/MocA family oxidoreductase [Vagococcus allomyrinae]